MKPRLIAILLAALTAGASCFGALPAEAKINVDFRNEYLETILRNVGDLYGLNLSMPAEFSKRKLSLTLKQVNWEQVYELCLYGSGYTFVDVGNGVVQIVPLDNDLKVVALLRVKLDAETNENREFRHVMIEMVKSGLVTCPESEKARITQFIQNVNHRPADCLEVISKAGLTSR